MRYIEGARLGYGRPRVIRFRALRAFFFFPLLWLRRLFFGLSRLASGFFGLAGTVVLFISTCTRYHNWLLGGAMLAVSFLAFLAMFLYDSLLMSLNPTDRTFFFY
jgi:hypothetical protein